MSVTISLNSRAVGSLTFGVNASDTGMTELLFEFNRSADFSSDDSLFKRITEIGPSVTTQAMNGLPGGTTWYVRAISNAVGAAYSNVVLAATTEPTLNAGYSGFSIDKAMMVSPVPITAVVDNFGPNNMRLPGFPPSNLLRDDPQSTWQVQPYAGDTLNASLSFQTSGELIDTIALLGTLANDDIRWSVQSSPTPSGFGLPGSTWTGMIPMRCSPTIDQRSYYHALHILSTPTTNRFWAIGIDGSGLTDHIGFIARHLVLGLALRSVNASRGATEAMNDTGTFSRGRFGTPDRVAGWRGRTVDFEMSWLSENEYQTKWAPLQTLIGKTKPVLALPNSKRNAWTNDRIAYGPMEMRGENMQASKHGVGITIDSLY